MLVGLWEGVKKPAAPGRRHRHVPTAERLALPLGLPHGTRNASPGDYIALEVDTTPYPQSIPMIGKLTANWSDLDTKKKLELMYSHYLKTFVFVEFGNLHEKNLVGVPHAYDASDNTVTLKYLYKDKVEVSETVPLSVLLNWDTDKISAPPALAAAAAGEGPPLVSSSV